MIEVRMAVCHDTCLDVEGPNNHVANVNPVSDVPVETWRVDCDHCFTCVGANFSSKAEARDAAVQHVQMSTEEYRASLVDALRQKLRG